MTAYPAQRGYTAVLLNPALLGEIDALIDSDCKSRPAVIKALLRRPSRSKAKRALSQLGVPSEHISHWLDVLFAE